MSMSAIPPSSLRKKTPEKKAEVFLYDMYECVNLLKVNKSSAQQTKNDVHIEVAAVHENHGRYLVVLVCDNCHLLMYYKEDNEMPKIKQIKWFENPSKKIVDLAIDPLRGAWLLCICADQKVFLMPAITIFKDKSFSSNAVPSWSRNDISPLHFSTKPLKGVLTCVEWWHGLDDSNIAIVGTSAGEIIFLDISQHEEVGRTLLKEKISKMKLIQDINERTTHLFVYGGEVKCWTIQLLLEQPSKIMTIASPSSLNQALDMGFDMLAECTIESILTSQTDNKDDINLNNRIEFLPMDFAYSHHFIGDHFWLGKFDKKVNGLEFYSDMKRSPEYIYHIPAMTSHILLSENIIFTMRDVDCSISILSRHFSSTSLGRHGLKKLEPSKKAEIQLFQLAKEEKILDCQMRVFKRYSRWKEDFPYNAGFTDTTSLSSFLIITNNGLLECRPKFSPEHYFTELAFNHGTDVAGKIGMTFDLNIPLLYEFSADKAIKEKDLENATKFYNLSKCDSIKRALRLAEHATITECLIFIKQTLKKQPNNINAKKKKKLADMAIICYIQQTLEFQRTGTFSKNLSESFKSFICDNFDYDEQNGMELLLSHGMIDNLFEMAKARGKIDEALNLLVKNDIYYLPSQVQIMLLDCGYAETLCNCFGGAFLKHMAAEQMCRFLLFKPNVTNELVETLTDLLDELDETLLLQIARVFDPSRQFIKPYLEKSSARKRSGSRVSMTSSSSTNSSEDSSSPSADNLILIFMKTIIKLNEVRKSYALPNLKHISRHLSGQLSWSASICNRSDSFASNEVKFSEVSRLKLACGRHHTAFVTSDKELYTWGKTQYGRLGHGDLVEDRGTYQPLRVESLHMHGIQVLSVACGAMHTIALCQEGVFAWGFNKYGQLGVGDKRNRSRPTLLSELTSKCIISVVCGSYHTLAISSDYRLYAWGWGVHGQLGLKVVENQLTPQLVKLLEEHRIIQAAAGYAHSAVLTSRGTVYTFGGGLYGQLGIGTNVKKTTPQLVQTLSTDIIYMIACGSFETIAVSDEQIIYCWGRNYHQYHICGKAESASYGRQMASNKTDLSHRYLPEDLPFRVHDPITQMVCGSWHYMVLTSAGVLYTWGYNDCGQLGHYNKIEQIAPRPVKALSRRSVVAIAAGSEYSVVVDDEDQVLAWGRADGGLIGVENESSGGSIVARRSNFSVLAPTPVQGLPIHFDQVSITSARSLKKEYVFDRNYELPDLSSIGEDQTPYTTEAILLSMFRLNGLYNPLVLAEYARHTHQWFVLSYCYEMLQQWDKVFEYRTKAVHQYIEHRQSSRSSYFEKMLLLVTDLFNKFEDFLTEDIDEDSSFVAMVTCMIKIFDMWQEENFDINQLENLLRKHMEYLAPVYTIVLFGFLANGSQSSAALRFALYQCTVQHSIASDLSSQFFNELLLNVVNQLGNGMSWFTFLSGLDFENEIIQTLDDGPALTTDEMLSEILEHRRKLFYIKPYISLSNAVATTLVAATIAEKVENFAGDQAPNINDLTSPESIDSTVFTCSHNLPRYYMLETVIPEFISRMKELPECLHRTAVVMSKFYEQTDIRIPLACPYCVYNNLRASQLQMLRESGIDIVNIRSSVWEI